MGMLLHRHLAGAIKTPAKVVEEEKVVKKEKANDNKRKDNNSKNISK